jgi:hypothetical protein
MSTTRLDDTRKPRVPNADKRADRQRLAQRAATSGDRQRADICGRNWNGGFRQSFEAERAGNERAEGGEVMARAVLTMINTKRYFGRALINQAALMLVGLGKASSLKVAMERSIGIASGRAHPKYPLAHQKA